jgi:hypothetical protein
MRIAKIMLSVTILIGGSIALLLANGIPAKAFSEPVQGTDNATDVVLWYGENFTIQSGELNINITGLPEAISDALEKYNNAASQRLNDIYIKVLEFLLVMSMILMSYIFKDRWLCVGAGFAMMLYGWHIWKDIPYFSVILVIWGLYNLSRAKYDRKAWLRNK